MVLISILIFLSLPALGEPGYDPPLITGSKARAFFAGFLDPGSRITPITPITPERMKLRARVPAPADGFRGSWERRLSRYINGGAPTPEIHHWACQQLRRLEPPREGSRNSTLIRWAGLFAPLGVSEAEFANQLLAPLVGSGSNGNLFTPAEGAQIMRKYREWHVPFAAASATTARTARKSEGRPL